MSDQELRQRVEDLEQWQTEYENLAEAVRTKANKNQDQVAELVDLVEDLAEKVERLEATATDRDQLDWDRMTTEDKLRTIRETMVVKARQNGGRAAMDYNGAKDALGGHPSNGHAVDLLKKAATADGFRYQERSDGNNRLIYDAKG